MSQSNHDDSEEPQRRSRTARFGLQLWESRIDFACVVVLSIASLAAAWSGYQAASWDGRQTQAFSQAGDLRVESTRASANGNQTLIVDVSLFNGWAEAYAKGDEQLMSFYRNRFSPEMEVALVDWIATDPLNNPDAPEEPFGMPSYVNADLDNADRLEAEANERFEQGSEANERGGEYVLTTVFFATVLFFAGLATKVRWVPGQVGMVAFSAAMLVFSLIVVATQPVA
jgi:hypothetical protein